MSIEEVKSGDGITADWANEVAQRADREITGPNVLQTPYGVHIAASPGGSGGSLFRWCIVREVDNDADLTVKVEYAQKGRDYDDLTKPLDYGRWVGNHEFLRTATSPPNPIPPFVDSLTDAILLPHTVAHDWRYALYPNPEDAGNGLYRATHVDDTDIILAMMVSGKPMLIPIFRDANGEVAETTRQFDCTVEAP